MRVASALAARMPPPWTAMRRASPCGAANNSASSASTKAAVLPRKCTPTTATPASTGFVRSTTEGVSGRRSLIVGALPAYLYSHAALETFADAFLRQIAADEDEPAQALLAFLPRALVVAVEDHVYALEHEALVIALEREDTFAAQDVGPVLL